MFVRCARAFQSLEKTCLRDLEGQILLTPESLFQQNI